MIILVTGDFGVGKDTFADMLLEHLGSDAQKIKSYTTREPRYEGEDTHIFVSKQQWLFYVANKSYTVIAQTNIGGEYYGTLNTQFSMYYNFDDTYFDIYVVDDLGVRDVIAADIDEVYIIEVIRPKWLINVDSERLNRERIDSYDFIADFRVLNDGSLENLDGIAKDISNHLKLNKPIK